MLVCQHLACSADEGDKGVVSVALLLLRRYPFLFDASNLDLQIPLKSDFSQGYLRYYPCPPAQRTDQHKYTHSGEAHY